MASTYLLAAPRQAKIKAKISKIAAKDDVFAELSKI